MLGAYITAGITLFIVILMYKAAFKRREYLYRLQQIGMTTLGSVIDVKLGKDSDGDTTYAPVIGYTTFNEGHRVYTMSSSTRQHKKVGDVVPVTYDPARPEKPEIGSIHPERVLIGVTIGAVIVIGMGVLIALSLLGVIQSSGDGSDDAAFLLPFPIILMAFTRIKGLVKRV